MDLLSVIHLFLEYQKNLIKILFEKYENKILMQNKILISTIEENETINYKNENWIIKKHGSGFEFISSKGISIDVHNHLENLNIFDASRIEAFIESTSEINKNFNISNIKDEINILIDRNEIKKYDNWSYTLK